MLPTPTEFNIQNHINIPIALTNPYSLKFSFKKISPKSQLNNTTNIQKNTILSKNTNNTVDNSTLSH